MKTLTEILAQHRFLFFRIISDGDEETGEGRQAIPHCVCGWEGDDWPAHVAAAYREARTITNEPDLAALHEHHPGPPAMSGVLIKESLYGDMFETCDDGTWDNIGNPQSDAPPILPVLVLWLPEDET